MMPDWHNAGSCYLGKVLKPDLKKLCLSILKNYISRIKTNHMLLTTLKPTFIFKAQYRTVLKRLLFSLIIGHSSFCAFAQQPAPVYNLLWRISGKGLKKPSYLFGTMHVKDKRAFHFSDSVMAAINKTDAFALEVHPDTLEQQMLNTLFQADTTRNLHKLLSKDEYDQLAQRFKERNGYEMTDADPMLIESMMTDETKTPDGKQTFVDAYLYGIARTLSKKIYGLENAKDQFNTLYGTNDDMKDRLLALLDLDDKEERDKEEELVKIYSSGNLEAIKNYLSDEQLEDEDLVTRNQVMAKKIIDQLSVQTLFSAIGVAHLPGNHGVIELLRRQGYTVTAVAATFTGASDNYHIDYLKMAWPTYTNSNLGYSANMPGAPIKATINGLRTDIYVDLTTGTTFGTYAFVKGTDANPVKAEVVINNIIDNYKKSEDDKLISKKSIVVNGLACTDVVIKNKTNYIRMNIYIQNNILYCLYVGNTLESINQPFANRFFNSFKCFKVAPKAEEPWVNYTNNLAAFKVLLPSNPQEMLKESPNTLEKGGESVKLHLLYTTDTVNLVNYIVRYNDFPSAAYLGDNNTYFSAIEKELTGTNKPMGPFVKIWKDGLEGREIKVILANKYYTTIQIFPRGNRIYFLMRQSLTEGTTSQKDDAFFSSFKFIPFQEAPAYSYEPKDQPFKIQMPVKPRILADTTKSTSYIINSVTSYATNPNSGGVYGFEYSFITPYYRAASVDSMYNHLIKNMVHYTDSLIKQDTVMIAGHKAREYITIRKGATNKTRHRLLIDNGTVYYLTGRLSDEELFSPTANTFFNSLAIDNTALKFDLTSSKAEKIKDALLSMDSTVYKSGRQALSYYKFEVPELPFVYTALNHQYTDDTTDNGTRVKLVNKFQKIHDEHTFAYLQKLYADADGKDALREAILEALPIVDQHKGYDEYLNMLTTSKPLKTTSTWGLFTPLRDSLSYTAANFNKILPLVNAPGYRYEVLRLASNMADDEKHKEYLGAISGNFKYLTAHAKDDLDKYMHADSTNEYETRILMYRYFNLMQQVKGQPLTNEFTNKLLSLKGNPLASNAIVTRIYNHLPVNQILVNKLLDSLESRYEVMEAYNKEKQIAKVPLKYTSQAEFGRLCVYNYLNDTEDEGYPDKISLLGNITNKGQLYYAYKFTMSAKEEGKTFLAIAGPFKPGLSKLDFKSYHSYTSFDEQKLNWKAQVLKMIPKLIESEKNAATD